jgi:cell division protein FtsB
MRIIWGLLICAFIGLQYKLWLGDGNFRDWMSLVKKNKQQQQVNDNLRARNNALIADINELKSGDQALEEKARYDLGMVKADETFYRLAE